MAGGRRPSLLPTQQRLHQQRFLPLITALKPPWTTNRKLKSCVAPQSPSASEVQARPMLVPVWIIAVPSRPRTTVPVHWISQGQSVWNPRHLPPCHAHQLPGPLKRTASLTKMPDKLWVLKTCCCPKSQALFKKLFNMMRTWATISSCCLKYKLKPPWRMAVPS